MKDNILKFKKKEPEINYEWNVQKELSNKDFGKLIMLLLALITLTAVGLAMAGQVSTVMTKLMSIVPDMSGFPYFY